MKASSGRTAFCRHQYWITHLISSFLHTPTSLRSWGFQWFELSPLSTTTPVIYAEMTRRFSEGVLPHFLLPYLLLQTLKCHTECIKTHSLKKNIPKIPPTLPSHGCRGRWSLDCSMPLQNSQGRYAGRARPMSILGWCGISRPNLRRTENLSSFLNKKSRQHTNWTQSSK